MLTAEPRPQSSPPVAPAEVPTIVVERSHLARWLELVEAAIDNAPERIDILCDLAASIEDVWLSPEAAA